MNKPKQYPPQQIVTSRREFLKKTGLISLGTLAGLGIIATFLGKNEEENIVKPLEDDNDAPSTLPLRKKPIHLGYKEIVKDKDIDMIHFPNNKWSMEARIARCLRWKPVTDAVEDRYHIPRGLLMAMMAQEGLGDPTMPNLPRGSHKYGDGGLGLIHIQAANAHKFGLKTLPRYTDAMCDDRHAKLIVEAIQKHGGDLPSLLALDDRFHPIMAVDVAGRFFMDGKKRVGKGKDSRIHALQKYSGRSYGGKKGYGHHVVAYWSAINHITGDNFPRNLSTNIKNDIHKGTKKGDTIKKQLQTLRFAIDGEEATYQQYLAYFEESMQNFELEKYVSLGDSVPTTNTEDIQNLPTETKENIKKPRTTRKNSLIKQEFIDTRQHNSEGFALYRYIVKKGDTALSISDAFDARDNAHGNKYKNTGNLNIVNFRGEPTTKFIPGQIVYIKAKK